MTARFPAALLVGCATLALVAPAAAAPQTVLSRFTGLFGRDDFEITPDGRHAVGRPNTALQTSAQVLDLASGAELSSVTGVLGLGYAGPC
jgi:hypothetical protein